MKNKSYLPRRSIITLHNCNSKRLSTSDGVLNSLTAVIKFVCDRLLFVLDSEFSCFCNEYLAWIQSKFLPVFRDSSPFAKTFVFPLEQALRSQHCDTKYKLLPAGRNEFAKFHTISSSKCCVCYKSPRPGSLLTCSCGTSYCFECYGAPSNLKRELRDSFICDFCRGEDMTPPTVTPKKGHFLCFDCGMNTKSNSKCHFPVQCSCCSKRFCEHCAATTRNEPAYTCWFCLGDEEYSKNRMCVAVTLVTKILGQNHANLVADDISIASFQGEKLSAANDLGDFLEDLYHVGEHEVFYFLLPIVMKMVTAQIKLKILPLLSPFHMFVCTGSHSMADNNMLRDICNAYAEDAEKQSKKLLHAETSASSASVPENLVVGFYSHDALNGPTADLICHAITNFKKEIDAFLFAHGPLDSDNLSAKHIYKY